MLRIAIIIPEVTQMDLIKIGNFIAELRKKQKLTQEQLGEKLGQDRIQMGDRHLSATGGGTSCDE